MKKIGAALAMVATLAAATSATAQVGVAGAFASGRTHVVVSAGNGYAFNETYFVLGLGVSYYVINGLNVGLSAEYWSGADPHVWKISPSVNYVFYQVPVVKPYIGAFYRRTYVENLPDLNSYGGRAGGYVQAGRNAYLGAGVVYETYSDCNTAIYRSCSDTYPELSFTVAF